MKPIIRAAACGLFVCALVATALNAEDSYSTNLNIAISTAPEAKITLAEKFHIPVLVGEGLFASNSLDLKISEEVSPVTVNLGFDAVLTPIAFLQFSVGAQIGSGWTVPGLAVGVGLVSPAADRTTTIATPAFENLMYKFKFGGVFQFDLAALVPGDWNHVVVRTYHEIYYRALTGVGETATWQYEADNAENRIGWNYYGNYFLGYQMPIFVQTIGMLLETDNRFYTTAGGDAWGDNLMRLNFGPLINFQITDNFSVAALAQWKTDRNYTAATKKLYYQYRVLDTANPLSIIWNRFALSVDITF